MKWIKRGLIFEASDDLPWMISHAAIPFAEAVNGLYKIYFSGRDDKGRARIGNFLIDINEPNKILEINQNPVIDIGPPGSYDDSGVTNSWIVKHKGKRYLYFSGWSLGVTVPFYFYIGLAISNNNSERFQKHTLAPVLGRDEIDPYLTASPCILIENDTWRMWYVSCTRWQIENGKAKHYYHIKYAESKDGIHWTKNGVVCIDFQSDDEFAIARPCVLKEDGIYKMWYSYRGKSYRIGYAESADGLKWQRKDLDVGIDVSKTGWDSEMIEYPFVFNHEGEKYMLYNGNGYGKTGIGLAVLDKEK